MRAKSWPGKQMREPDRLIFQFRILFDPAAIPSGLAERLQEKLRQWFDREGLDYGFGALGSSAVVYGEVGRRGAVATLLKGASYAEQWLPQLDGSRTADSAICVFPPNRMRHPHRSSLEYLGSCQFEIVHPAWFKRLIQNSEDEA